MLSEFAPKFKEYIWSRIDFCIADFSKGRPLFVRTESGKFNLANLMRAHLFSSMCMLKKGIDLLRDEEKVYIDTLFGHGGFFKTENVGQKIAAAIFDTPISTVDVADLGGVWGIAVLAAFMHSQKESFILPDYLERAVFGNKNILTVTPDEADAVGFKAYYQRYIAGLSVERAAIDNIE